MSSPSAVTDVIEALHRQSLTLPEQDGRRILRGRLLLEQLVADPGRRGDVESITTNHRLERLAEQLTGTMNVELLAMLPNTSCPAAHMASSRDGDLELLARGVRMDLLYEPHWPADPAALDGIMERVRAGARARVVDRVPHRLIMFDRAAVLVPSTVVGRGPGAVFARARPVVVDLLAMFADTWQHATPVEDHSPTEVAPIADHDRRILGLMSSGLTDEAAAKTLEVSVRTYRRHVATLMQRLGAETRFQAGVAAVRRGWI